MIDLQESKINLQQEYTASLLKSNSKLEKKNLLMMTFIDRFDPNLNPCIICAQPLHLMPLPQMKSEYEILQKVKCGHNMCHLNCYADWLQTSDKCPICQ